jgi:hypothetical protein
MEKEVLSDFTMVLGDLKNKVAGFLDGKGSIGMDDVNGIEPLVTQGLSDTPLEAKKNDIRTKDGYEKAKKEAVLYRKVTRWFTH